nr:histone deacetylase [Ardenticatena sp.]
MSQTHHPVAYYSDTFVLPLPEGHRFPMQKYRLLRERVLAEGIIPPEQLAIPPAATDEMLQRAHTTDYVHRVQHGVLTRQEIRRVGFPWSPQMVERSRRSVGATVAAAHTALHVGVGINLAGGTHHATADEGQGFCVFNDVAVAARTLQAEGLITRVLVVDCDVHQGNGTAAIFADDPTVYTFSIHGAKNFPFRKINGDLDIGLDDNTDDETYLAALERGLTHAFDASAPEIVFYVSGADPFAGDRLGRLALTKTGLAERDRMVFSFCRQAGTPVVVVMAGGYAVPIEETVDIHVQTIRLALAHLRLEHQPQ